MSVGAKCAQKSGDKADFAAYFVRAVTRAIIKRGRK